MRTRGASGTTPRRCCGYVGASLRVRVATFAQLPAHACLPCADKWSALPATCVVKVKYSLSNPKGVTRFIPVPNWVRTVCWCLLSCGVTWCSGLVAQTPDSPKHYLVAGAYPHPCFAGATLGGCSGPRSWFPCIDHLQSACKFVLNVVPVSKFFKDSLVIASGDLQPVTRDPVTGCHLFSFRVDVPVAASAIGLVAGRFVALSGGTFVYQPQAASTSTSSSRSAHQGTGSSTQAAWPGEENSASTTQAIPAHTVMVSHFAPPGHAEELAHTTTRVVDGKSVLRCLVDYLQAAFPFGSYKQVFVPGLPWVCTPFAGGAMLSMDVLHSPRAVDPAVHARRVQAMGVASSYIGCLVGLDDWSDLWLQVGLAWFLADQAVFQLNGRNEEEERHRTHLAMEVSCRTECCMSRGALLLLLCAAKPALLM